LAVVDNAPAGGDLFRPLLLALRAVLEGSVSEDLQIYEANRNCSAPQNEDTCQNVEPEVGAIAGCAGGH
jgi:hypothetical protein